MEASMQAASANVHRRLHGAKRCVLLPRDSTTRRCVSRSSNYVHLLPNTVTSCTPPDGFYTLPRTHPNIDVCLLSSTTKGKQTKSPTGPSKREFSTKRKYLGASTEGRSSESIFLRQPRTYNLRHAWNALLLTWVKPEIRAVLSVWSVWFGRIVFPVWFVWCIRLVWFVWRVWTVRFVWSVYDLCDLYYYHALHDLYDLYDVDTCYVYRGPQAWKCYPIRQCLMLSK